MRVLVVQTAFLGDVVLTTPLLKEIQRANPGAHLTVLTTPVGGEVLEGLPYVERVIRFDKRGPEGGWRGTLRLARRLRAERPDVVVAAQRSFRTGLLARLSGAPSRIGWEKAAGAWAYTSRVPWRADDHAVRRYLALAGPAGGDPARPDAMPEIAVPEEARRKVATLLAERVVPDDAALLALAPGSIWGTKRWTREGFAAVARAAGARGLRPVLVGSAGERELCEEVAAGTEGALVLAGATTIPEMAALLLRARALVANDSGPGHVAAAVGTPVVTIFGPTVPAFGYAPYGPAHRIVELNGLECRPCHRHGPATCPLGHHRCMKDLSAARVIEALDQVLRGVAGVQRERRG